LLAAGVILVIKQGDSISFILRWANTLFCGIYFPMEVLPQGLQYIARIFPLTYGLEGIRLIALNSCGLNHPQVIWDIIFMACFSAISLPLGMLAFERGYKKARRDGSLSFY
jgi:ABC-2 type transport system permease protein